MKNPGEIGFIVVILFFLVLSTIMTVNTLDLESEVRQLEKEKEELEEKLNEKKTTIERKRGLEEVREDIGNMKEKLEDYTDLFSLIEGEARTTNPDLTKEESRKITSSIIFHSAKRNLDPVLVTSLIKQESRFDPKNVGSDEDLGLMQIIPSTGRWIADEMGITYSRAKLLTIDKNIDMGTYYLSVMVDKFGCEEKALVAYNKGPHVAQNVDATQDGYRSAVRYHYSNISE